MFVDNELYTFKHKLCGWWIMHHETQVLHKTNISTLNDAILKKVFFLKKGVQFAHALHRNMNFFSIK